MHFPPLITDLALILLMAGTIGLLFRWLNQPVVLGYLVAGILVGPEITLVPTVDDTMSIKTWAELGVIFLLFVLGLEFSFKKLVRVGRTAVITAVLEVGLMTAIGFGLGKALGWKSIDAVFLGSVLSISSSTIIVKAFEDLGVKSQFFAHLTFGVLIVEDLLAILLVTALPSLALSKDIGNNDLFPQLLKVLSFLVFVVPLGLWGLPRLMHRLRRLLGDESRVIVSLSICLGLVYLGHKAGATSALGAFLAGAFLAETLEGERIERLLHPIRDLFGAIFFVSIGMLVDLKALQTNIGVIGLVTVVTIVGKFVSTFIGMKASGQKTQVSWQTGLSMAQIGEFSFIIAAMGVTLGVIRADLYAIAVAVSVITTFATPYLIRFAQSLGQERSADAESRKAESIPRIWDSHLADFEIHPHFTKCGEKLSDLKLRETFGVTVVSLKRGELRIIAPTRDDRLMPHDLLTAVGTDHQLQALGEFLKVSRIQHDSSKQGAFALRKVEVKKDSKLVGQNLRASGIREAIDGLVLGIERQEKRILNPDSTTRIESGDRLWIFGIWEKIKSFENRF